MQFNMCMRLMLGVCFLSGVASAQEPAAAPISKRELTLCMTRQMASHRTLSYNDAAKECKGQLEGRKLQAASREAPKSLGGT